jgi:hypothetical protein
LLDRAGLNGFRKNIKPWQLLLLLVLAGLFFLPEPEEI